MSSPLKPKIELNNLSPDVKSYIYQAIAEFEPFTTPETLVTVVAKDPLQLLTAVNELSAQEIILKRNDLKKMFRISITLDEAGTKISEEGLHEDIYQAIKIAKDKLIMALTKIQDDLITNQDRQVQIKTAIASGNGYFH